MISRDWPRPATAWLTISVLTLAAVLSYADRQMLNLMVDPIKSDLQISDVEIGLLQGMAFSIVYAFALLPVGRLADIYPRKRLISVGVIIWSIATIACGLAGSFVELAVARICVGVGEAVLTPAGISMIGDSFPPERRGAATGVFLMGMSIGSGSALLLGGRMFDFAAAGGTAALPFISNLAPWRFPFLVLGVFGLAFSLATISIREPVRHAAGGEAIGRPRLSDAIAAIAGLKTVIFPIIIATALMGIAGFAAISWAPTLLSRQFHLKPGAIGSILGPIHILAGIAGSVGAGILADMVMRKRGVRGQFGLLTAISLAAILAAIGMLAQSMPLLLSSYAVILLLNNLCGTVAMTALQSSVPPFVRGLAASMLGFGNIAIGLGFGALLTGLALQEMLRDPNKVALGIVAVSVPSALMAAIIYYATRRAWREPAVAKSPPEPPQV